MAPRGPDAGPVPGCADRVRKPESGPVQRPGPQGRLGRGPGAGRSDRWPSRGDGHPRPDRGRSTCGRRSRRRSSEAQRLAAEAWGARRSWFLINGASQGNHAACLALAPRGRAVVVQRNVHSAPIDGSILAGLDPAFVAPELDPELGVAHCLTPASLDRALDDEPGAVGAHRRLPHLLRRLRRRRRPRRGRPFARAAAGRRRGVGGAPALPPRPAPGRALGRRRPRRLVDPQDRRQPHPVGDAPPRRGQIVVDGVVDRCVTPGRVDQPEQPALRLARRGAAPRRGARRGAAQRDARGAGATPGGDPRHPRPRRARPEDGRPRRRRRLGSAAAPIDVRGTGATGYRLAQVARELDDINFELFAENVAVAVFGMGAPAAPQVERLVAALRRAVERIGDGPPARATGVRAAAALGGAGDDPARRLPRARRTWSRSAPPRAGSRRSRWPPIRPGSPTCCRASASPAETLDYVTESIAHGGFVRGRDRPRAEDAAGGARAERSRRLGRRLRARPPARRPALPAGQLPLAADQRDLPRDARQRAALRRRRGAPPSTRSWSPSTSRPGSAATSWSRTRPCPTRCSRATRA